MSQLEKLAERLEKRSRPEPLTDREALMDEILNHPVRGDDDYLELLRKISCKGDTDDLD